MEQDLLFEEIGVPWLVDARWNVVEAPPSFRQSANGGNIVVSQGFSREWIEERVAQLASAPQVGRRWLLEIAFGKACITRIERVSADARTTPSQGDLFRVKFAPVISLNLTQPDALAKVHPCMHAHLGELAHLTRRELEVYRLLGKGASNGEVAKSVVRTTRLVESVTLRLRRGLGGDSLRTVIAHSAQSGLYCLADDHFATILANHHPRKAQATKSKRA